MYSVWLVINSVINYLWEYFLNPHLFILRRLEIVAEIPSSKSDCVFMMFSVKNDAFAILLLDPQDQVLESQCHRNEH